jgi:hypothetical protein
MMARAARRFPCHRPAPAGEEGDQPTSVTNHPDAGRRVGVNTAAGKCKAQAGTFAARSVFLSVTRET